MTAMLFPSHVFRALAEIARYARFSAAAVSRDLGFSFPPPKTTA